MTFFLGALLPLAFAPWSWAILALIIPGLYEICLNRTKRPALSGFLFGLGLFGVGASWIFVSIHEYSEAPLYVALTITLGFILGLSGIMAFSAWLYKFLRPHTQLQRVLIFPAIWVLTEAFRGWFLTGFPWLYLGDTVIDTPFRGYLPILGVYGVSWMLALMSVILLQCRHRPYWPKALPLILIVGLAFTLNKITWTETGDYQYTVSLVQGNIPQLTKWDPKQADANFKRYRGLTAESLDSEIIIWPEASLPVPMPYATRYMDELKLMLKPHHNALLVGELVSTGNDEYLNSAQAIGDGRYRYDKTHLVPFGEYLPFHDLLGPLLEKFRLPTPTSVPGSASQVPVMLKQWKTAILICYEIAYPIQTLKLARNSDVLITISNDTWFGRSFGPDQHFQIARTRAAETGRYLLRATNNGITGFIGPQGQVLSKAPQFVATTLTHEIQGMQGNTPLMIYGHKAIFIFALMLIIIGLVVRRR